MNASQQNKVTCAAKKCSQPGDFMVRFITPSTTRVADGKPMPVEVNLEFCLVHRDQAAQVALNHRRHAR